MPTATDKPFVSVSLPSPEGMVHARHYVVVGSKYAVVMVGNSNRKFDSPARKLYPRLAEALKQQNVTALHISLCDADSHEQSSHDVCVGVQYLCGLGSKTLILLGYDRGAAAVLSAAQKESCVTGVALLSPPAVQLRPESAFRLLILQSQASKSAAPNTEVRVLADSGPSLDEAADEVFRTLDTWIRKLQQDDNSQAA